MTAERWTAVELPLISARHHGGVNLRRRAAWYALLALWLIVAAGIIVAVTPHLGASQAPAYELGPIHFAP